MHHGDIVRVVEMPDARGVNPKPFRPAVVVSTDAEIASGGPVRLIGISTLLPGPPPPDCVPLAYKEDLPGHSGTGHPRTGLKTRCAAFPTWRVLMSYDRIREGKVAKRTSPEELDAIAAILQGFVAKNNPGQELAG